MRHISMIISWTNEELVAEVITDDIDKHFRSGFALHWDDHLNHWMVDHDIICILKSYVGYSSWTDVPTKQRELCYKNYNQNMTLPEWDIEQERYWQVSTVNSVLEYIVYSYVFVEEKFQDNLSFASWCAR
jgi:hypothetical protein